jgi:hypothetical protein
MQAHIAGLIAVWLLTGCVAMTPEGQRVRLVRDSRTVDSCKYISQIASTSYWGGLAAKGLAEDNAAAELRNQAAQAGGDTLLLVTSRVGMSATRMSGNVYRCLK